MTNFNSDQSDLHVRVTLSTIEGRTGQAVLDSMLKMKWDQKDNSGHDVTQAALFESFRISRTNSIETVASYNASGDNWRAIESVGNLSQIARDVRNGIELCDAVEKQCAPEQTTSAEALQRGWRAGVDSEVKMFYEVNSVWDDDPSWVTEDVSISALLADAKNPDLNDEESWSPVFSQLRTWLSGDPESLPAGVLSPQGLKFGFVGGRILCTSEKFHDFVEAIVTTYPEIAAAESEIASAARAVACEIVKPPPVTPARRKFSS